MTLNISELPKELINYASDFLNIIEKQKMKYTCKLLNHSVRIKKENFEPILVKRINEITKSSIGEKLLKLIKNSNNLIEIGGSTIIQCLYNSFYDESDLDLYVFYDNIILKKILDDVTLRYVQGVLYDSFVSQDYIKNIFDLMKETKLKPDNPIDLYGPEENYMIDGHHINYYDESELDKDNRKVKLQIILLPIECNYENYYDFTFCRNHYNGFNINSYKKQDVINKIGKMNKWQNIYDRAVYTKGCTQTRVCEHILLRANKYVKRGYKILNYQKRLEQIDEETKKDILRDYYEGASKIVNIVDSQFNNWMQNKFEKMSGVIMQTRTIEVDFQTPNVNEIKTIINNKGNPILKGDERKRQEPIYYTKRQMLNLINGREKDDDGNIPSWADIVRYGKDAWNTYK